MMELVDKAECAIAQPPLVGVAQSGEWDAADEDFPGRGRIEPAQQVQQRALAGSRGADDGEPLAGSDGKIDAEQHRHLERPAAICFAQAAAFEHGRCAIHIAAPPRD